MKILLLAVLVLGLCKTTFGYCFAKTVPGTFCTAPNDATIPEGADLQMPERCEQCSCYKDTTTDNLILSCCGYGKNAGVFMAPEGCKKVIGDDGCSIKLVQIANETLPC